MVYNDDSVDELMVSDSGVVFHNYDNFPEYSVVASNGFWQNREDFLEDFSESKDLKYVNKDFYDVLMKVFSPKEIFINEL